MLASVLFVVPLFGFEAHRDVTKIAVQKSRELSPEVSVIMDGGLTTMNKLTDSFLNSVRETPVQLPTIFRAFDAPGGQATDGISVTAYGQGQLTAGLFTVPA